MRNLLIIAACLAATTAVSQTAVNKQVVCWRGDFQTFKRNMEKAYNEQLVAYGISMDNKTIVEWYENATTGTWTIVERKNDAICVIESGDKGPRS